MANSSMFPLFSRALIACLIEGTAAIVCLQNESCLYSQVTSMGAGLHPSL